MASLLASGREPFFRMFVFPLGQCIREQTVSREDVRFEFLQRDASSRDCRIRAIKLRTLAETVINEDLPDDFFQISDGWESFVERAAEGERKGRTLL
jgi:hypothetical protein